MSLNKAFSDEKAKLDPNDEQGLIELKRRFGHVFYPGEPGYERPESKGSTTSDLNKTPELDWFLLHMQKEINNNAHKGDWKQWTDEGDQIRELIYHVQKLDVALKINDRLLILERAADIANLAFFTAYNRLHRDIDG